jgi:predicted N-acetyltransferase YhbS
MVDFTLRPMEPSDGPAIDALMRHQAQTTSVGMTTHYRHDLYAALVAQHPSLSGVVAESPGIDGLVGMATAYFDDVSIDGQVFPCAHLENLKVHTEVRRHGLGSRLASWRIDEAQRRFGGECVVTAGVEATNRASLATAQRWSTHMLGPVRLVIARTSSKPSPRRGVEVRPMTDGDVDTVLARLDTFYAGYDLVPRHTPSGFAGTLAPTGLGEPIRAYRVAVAGDGKMIAGACVTERFKLMADHLDSIPLPLAILGRLTGLIPSDRMIRSIEISLAWHSPGHVDALRTLWDAIRFEWHGRANTVVGLADPRGTLIDAFHVGRSFAPRVELMAPVLSPVPLDPSRLLYMWR